jgi:hypothetical protein
MVFKTQLFLIIPDATKAEALARTTADGLQNTAISNNGCNSAETFEQQQMVFKTQYFYNTDATAEATTRTDHNNSRSFS